MSGLIYVASMLVWATGMEGGAWRYAVLDLFALVYFYGKWSAPDVQHRQFHFLMMLSYLASTSFYAFRSAVAVLPVDAFGMSPWWYQLISNMLFELELIFIVLYAYLYRRARADKKKFRSDAEQWLAKIRRTGAEGR